MHSRPMWRCCSILWSCIQTLLCSCTEQTISFLFSSLKKNRSITKPIFFWGGGQEAKWKWSKPRRRDPEGTARGSTCVSISVILILNNWWNRNWRIKPGKLKSLQTVNWSNYGQWQRTLCVCASYSSMWQACFSVSFREFSWKSTVNLLYSSNQWNGYSH